jgi:hypothetical protein
MLPVHSLVARATIVSRSRSALPGAPVVPAPVVPAPAAVPAARPRRAAAAALVRLADRVSPEPVERSRWQSG